VFFVVASATAAVKTTTFAIAITTQRTAYVALSGASEIPSRYVSVGLHSLQVNFSALFGINVNAPSDFTNKLMHSYPGEYGPSRPMRQRK